VSDVLEQTKKESADRPLLSLRDVDLRDLEFTNLSPYYITPGTGPFSLIGPGGGGGGGGGTNLGNLSPAAGNLGDLSPAAGGGLGNLAPSAGGLQGDQNITCANAYLDADFLLPPEQRKCNTGVEAPPAI
jgi:hypothetical protein